MNVPFGRGFAAGVAVVAALGSAAAGGTWEDARMGTSVDLGERWSVTAYPGESPGSRLGQAAVRFRDGDARGWMTVFTKSPYDPVRQPTEFTRLAAHLVGSRYEDLGERLLPGLARPAELGRGRRGILLEYEVAPGVGEGRTRVGRAAMGVAGERLVLLFAECPAAGVDAEAVASLESLVQSLRLDAAGADPGASAAQAPVESVPPPAAGDALPAPEFRSSVEMQRIHATSDGLEVFRQYYLFYGSKLPSYLVHLMGKEYEREGRRSKTPDLCLLLLKNRADAKERTLRVEIEIPGFAEASARTVVVAAGATVAVALSPVFSDALYELAEQRPGQIRLRIVDAPGEKPGVLARIMGKSGGTLLHEESEKIVLLGCNDFFWRDTTGRSWAPSVTALVTPHDRAKAVDALLRRAADHSSLGMMAGYQELTGRSRREIVEAQLRAVYDTVAADGFRYVNAPVSMDARAQRIKFPAETLADRSGNCIEAVLLFAAAVEAMGMRPVVVLYPTHAQLGVRAWEDDDTLFVIETTLCGRAPFAEALKRGGERLRDSRAKGEEIELVDVREWRLLGFTPVPR